MSDKSGTPSEAIVTNAPNAVTRESVVALNGHRRIQVAVGGESVAVLRSGDWKPIHLGAWSKPKKMPELSKKLVGFALDAERALHGTGFKTWRGQTGAYLLSVQTKNGVVHTHMTLPEDAGSRTVRAETGLTVAECEALLTE